jgi:hypothetical protein
MPSRSIFTQSSITNGKTLLPGVHKQSPWARRFYDINFIYASDQGGVEHLSEARRSIIRRIACLQVELERYEVKFARAGGAESSDLELYQRTSNSLRRMLESIGLDRIARDVTPPDPLAYAEAVRRKALEAEDLEEVEA